MSNKEFHEYKKQIVIDKFNEMGGRATINEVIGDLWENTSNKEKIKLGWRFFCHFNKLPAQLEKENRIRFTGKMKMGNTKLEKIWIVS